MTLENLLSQMGIGTKQLTERYSEYGAPVHDPNVYYAYEQPSPPHGHTAPSKHGSGLKTNASMSALTLLAFLFFLHILQQCIKDHMNDMSHDSPVVVMTAGRESEDIHPKTAKAKVDKSGVTQNYQTDRIDVNEKIKSITDKYDKRNPFDAPSNKNRLMKIDVAEHVPNTDRQKNDEYAYKRSANRSSDLPGFVNAMDEKK